MSEMNPFENVDTEFLVQANPYIAEFQKMLDNHRLIINASFAFTKAEIVEAYTSLLNTFDLTMSAGQMAMETELITRDLTDIDPEQ